MTSGNDTEKCRETIHTLPLRISKKSIFSLYEKSEDFRNAINDGDYIYLDGLFVLRPLATLFIKNGLDINDYIKKMASVGLISSAADYCLAIESVYVPYPYDPNVLRHSAGYVKSERIIHAAKRGALKDITKDEFEGVLSDENEPANDYTTYENDGTKIYTYSCRLTDEGVEHHNSIVPQYSYYYYIKIVEYADGEHWKISTGYSAYGDKDKGWIEKYAQPWDAPFQD